MDSLRRVFLDFCHALNDRFKPMRAAHVPGIHDENIFVAQAKLFTKWVRLALVGKYTIGISPRRDDDNLFFIGSLVRQPSRHLFAERENSIAPVQSPFVNAR